MVGSNFAQYRVLRRIGQGGMGEVYLAEDSVLRRKVALKFVLERPEDEVSRKRLIGEARAAAALDHPFICKIYETGQTDGQPFIAMEYVEGTTLRERGTARPFTLDEALHITREIAEALGYAHKRGIIHRDLKPSNVILTEDHHVKVMDFGIAKRTIDEGTTRTTMHTWDGSSAERFAGTPGYMSPEQVCGETIDSRSDIFALGIMLYEMVTGTNPFLKDSALATLHAIVFEAAPPVTQFAPNVPRLDSIVRQLLAKKREERYVSLEQLRSDLECVNAVTNPGGRTESRQATSRFHLLRAKSSPTLLTILLGLAGVAALAALSLTITHRAVPAPSTSTVGGRLTRVVESPGRAFDPTLSSDGKKIAYVRDDDHGRIDLFVDTIASGSSVRLTNDDAREGHPRFSPDGEQILFQRVSADTGESELCVQAIRGGDASVVLSAAAQPTWSPDATRIAFVQVEDMGTPRALATARSDGSDVRVLLTADAEYPFVRFPAWSPDGRTIAVVRGRGGIAGEIWLVPADGGPPVRFSNDPPAVFSDEPAFSGDGQAIVYSSNRAGATNIWSAPLNGQSAIRLTTGSGPDESPTISKTGQIAFLNTRWLKALLLHGLNDHRSRTLLTQSDLVWAPAFSFDGQQIAYSRGEADGAWHIWVVGRNGEQPRQLTSTTSGELYPRYLQDDRSLIYHTWTTPRRIWRIPRDGGAAEGLTPPDWDASFGDVSSDGKQLAFVVTESTKMERIYLLPLAGGVPTLLTATQASLPRWSPDGEWIAYALDRGYGGGIWVIRSNGSAKRRLTKDGGWPVWWPDGRKIGYRTIAPDGSQQIETVSISAPGIRTKLDIRFEGANYPFDIARDGTTLVTSNALHFSDEIWVLDR